MYKAHSLCALREDEGRGQLRKEEVVERKDIVGRGGSMFKGTEACKFLSCLGKGYTAGVSRT